MPVSDTENAITWLARSQLLVVGRPAALAALAIENETEPWCVNLNALESRFLMICCSRLTSVTSDFGSGCSMSIAEVEVLGLGEVAEAPLDERCRSSMRTSLTSTATVPDSIFDRSRMSLISISRSLPDEWIVFENSTCLRRQVAVRVLAQLVGQDQQAVERRAQLVRHVGEELGLVLRGERELLGLFLERLARLLDFLVLALDLLVLVRQQPRLLLQLLVGLLQLLLAALQLLGERLRLRQQVFRARVRLDRVDARCRSIRSAGRGRPRGPG